MKAIKKLGLLAVICAWGLLLPSFASAYLITGSGTGTGGATLSSSADFSFGTHDFGSGSVNAIQIILTNTGPATTVRGNLLTGLFWTFSGFSTLSTAIDGLAGTVKYLIPNGPGPSDDAIGTNYNVDIAPAASTSGMYMLANLGGDTIANNGIDYSAYAYGIGTVGYGLTGFDGNAVDGDDYGIAASGTDYLGNVKTALPVIDYTATFWIPAPAGITTVPELENLVFVFGSLPDNNVVPPPPAVPEPASMLLMGAGLMTWGVIHRRRRKAKS